MSASPNQDRELFGTLLASTPPRSRSWKSLGFALALHFVLITAAIVTFKPFQPREAHEEFQPITISIVEDEAVQTLPNPFVRSSPAQTAPPARSGPRKQEDLVYRPGPPGAITSDPNAPETVEPNDAGVSGTGMDGSLSSRLIPRGVDPRVTSPTAFPPAEKTGVEAVRERINDRLSAYNDSLAAEAAARYTDWTLTGRNGARWGVTTDTIYLGSIKIPTKRVALQPPAGRRDEINARARDHGEIERQAMLEESRSSFKERVQAIRARKEAERAEKKRKTEELKPITESR